MKSDRTPSFLRKENDEVVDPIQNIRPLGFDGFVGQDNVKENLKVFIAGAKIRKDSMDHVLFYGPPGLGKTTLAQIVANELGVSFKSTSGPILTKAGDLAAILTALKPNDVLFIDEIHRLSIGVEEILYSAMEDYKIDVMIGEGPSARSIKINIKPFTLIGATTRLGLLSSPLRTRFGIPLNLEFYKIEELSKVIMGLAAKLLTKIEPLAAYEIGRRSRGTPRIAIRLFRRVRDFAFAGHALSYPDKVVEAEDIVVREEVAKYSLTKLGIDELGLDGLDRAYLNLIANHYNGGPVGLDTIAAAMSEERDTIEDTIEPYLLQLGFISRTPRGRMLTGTALKYLNISLGSVDEVEGLFEVK